MSNLIDHQTPALLGDQAMFLANLQRSAYFRRGAMSSSTERARKTASEVFAAWCRGRGVVTSAVTFEDVVAFVDDMATRLKPATVSAYVSHIAALFDEAGVFPNPAKSVEVKWAKQRMYRSTGRRQKQATGITLDLRDKMLNATGDETLLGLRNRALLLVAFDTMLRRSELVALQADDLVVNPAKGSATILVRKSKTDQEGQGTIKYLRVETVKALRAWMDEAAITDGPLFRRVTRWGTPGANALSDNVVSAVFKGMAADAGLPAEVVSKISGHSTRVGAAQTMVARGISAAKIMVQGSWKSPAMLARYAQALDAEQGATAELEMMEAATA